MLIILPKNLKNIASSLRTNPFAVAILWVSPTVLCLVMTGVCLVFFAATETGFDPPTDSVAGLGYLFFLLFILVFACWAYLTKSVHAEAPSDKSERPFWLNFILFVVVIGVVINTQMASTRNFGWKDGHYHHWGGGRSHSIISESECHRLHRKALGTQALVFASWYLSGAVALFVVARKRRKLIDVKNSENPGCARS